MRIAKAICVRTKKSRINRIPVLGSFSFILSSLLLDTLYKQFGLKLFFCFSYSSNVLPLFILCTKFFGFLFLTSAFLAASALIPSFSFSWCSTDTWFLVPHLLPCPVLVLCQTFTLVKPAQFPLKQISL